MTDLVFALRSLRKSPVFTIVAILSLSLGIGANTAIFSLLDQLMLRSLPVKQPGELAQLAARGRHYGSNWGMNAMSYPMYRDIRDRSEAFAGLLCRRGFVGSLGYAGSVERARVELVSGNYFDVLGIHAGAGRLIGVDDDRTPGAHPVVVLTHDYWQSRFGGRRDILEQKIILNDRPFTVIGVTPPGFTGVEIGAVTQLFAPVMMQEQIVSGQKLLEERRTRFLNVFGRLKPGFTVESAQASLAPLYKQIIESEVREKAFAKADKESRDQFLRSTMSVFPGGTGTSFLRREFGQALSILMALTGVVLLIACANVANLQLARATGRQKEIAVRLAMGAGRWRIARQLLVESTLLSACAGLLGLVLGKIAVTALLAMFNTGDSDINITPALDPRVLLFNFGVAVLTGVLFGLAPALQATRPNLASTLKDQAGAVVGGAHSAFRKSLVTAQVSLSLVLLIVAALFVASLHNLRTVNPGFRTERLLMFGVNPQTNGYTVQRGNDFYKQLYERLAALPGVESVSSANMPLVSGDEWDSSLTIEGHDPSQGSKAWAYMNHVTPAYFATIGSTLSGGRDFRWNDVEKTTPVAIVNEQFVREYFPDRNPIGRHVGMGSDPGTKTDIEIIGVVRNFKYERMSEKTGRQMYRPVLQMKFALNQVFYVRTATEPQAMFSAIRNEVRKLDANLPIYGLRTLDEQVERNLATNRLVASLSACFGGLATLLAVVGLYGVMSYLVGRRSREIGIRMALGAQSKQVAGMILREVLLLVSAGSAIGLGAAYAATRLIKTGLYEVAPTEPRILIAATIALIAVASLAGWLPATRASRMDPLRILRYE
ncbi:MAG: ABC transporter permease [Candidatus Solibacter usitatus]|nr:ABC transporter permease [Candidatus Solibacter usitatus]